MQSDNRVYNHMTEEERVARVREVLAGTELAGVEDQHARVNEPKTRPEFNHCGRKGRHTARRTGCASSTGR